MILKPTKRKTPLHGDPLWLEALNQSQKLKYTFKPSYFCQFLTLDSTLKANGMRRKNIWHVLLRLEGNIRQIDRVCALENLSYSPMVRIMYDCN